MKAEKMEIYRNKSLESWSVVKANEVMVFETLKPRRVKFDLMSNDIAEVWVGYDESGTDLKYQGACRGQSSHEVTISQKAYIKIKTNAKASTVIRLAETDATIERPEMESFTNLNPMPRLDPAVDRLMKLQKINFDRVKAEMHSEFNKKISEMQGHTNVESANDTNGVVDQESETTQADQEVSSTGDVSES